MKRWEVGLTDYARKQLAVIKDRRIQAGLISSLKRLEYEPDVQGKPMKDELIGFRSLRAVGQRYRIIYKIQGQQVKVSVVAIGIRKEGDKKDIYAIARKLARLGLLDLEE
ncbi:MAG: type II toxin-antitoxin system RelE/ParE family toxin [Chloroflexota bacterium]|nr:type II toxin-antitoxin system RelE/ParE family toxin [Chloroflexota bacterium]